MDNNSLVNAAKAAMENAYAPYSSFKVGAAVLSVDGTVFTGCNIENSSYGATNCAERTAIFKGVSEGHTKFCKIAIVSGSSEKTFPCGICRQVMTEFMDKDAIILLADDKGVYEYRLDELIPNSFVI